MIMPQANETEILIYSHIATYLTINRKKFGSKHRQFLPERQQVCKIAYFICL